MNNFKLKITSRDELFGFQNKQKIHYEKDFKAFLSYLIHKGIVSADAISQAVKESRDEVINDIDETLNESVDIVYYKFISKKESK